MNKHPHLLFVVELVYFILFIPLMLIPIVGWAILIALSNYRERLRGQDE
jgi:hypothetical protein